MQITCISHQKELDFEIHQDIYKGCIVYRYGENRRRIDTIRPKINKRTMKQENK